MKVLALALLLAAPAAGQICPESFILRTAPCPPTEQDCTTKGSALTMAELDHLWLNLLGACDAIDSKLPLVEWTAASQCTGTNGGALTINAAGQVVCSDDDGGTGASTAGAVTVSPTVSGQSNVQAVLEDLDAEKAAASHTHAGADIASGTVPAARLPAASTSAAGVVELATSAETTAGLAVQASDTRLSDSRAPTAHAASHEDGGADEVNIEDLPVASTTAGQSVVTDGAGGLVLRQGLIVDTAAPSSPSTNDLWIDPLHSYRLCVYTPDGWVVSGTGADCDPVFWTLDVVLAGDGGGDVDSDPVGIACAGDCTEDYADSTSVDLTATPDGSSTFTAWSGCSSSTSPGITVAMDADKTCTATFTSTSSTAAADWGGSNVYAFWTLDSNTNGTSTSNVQAFPSTGSCTGNPCYLRQFGSSGLPVPIDTDAGDFVEGAGSAFFGPTPIHRAGCALVAADVGNGACLALATELTGSGGSSFSWALWHKPADSTSGRRIFSLGDGGTGGGGCRIERADTERIVTRCRTSSADVTLTSDNNACPNSAWCHIAVTYDVSTNALRQYLNGVLNPASGQPATVTGGIATPLTTEFVRIGYNASSATDVSGHVDEIGLDFDVVYTAQQACRLCSCGWDGSLCSCSSGTPANYIDSGRNAASCGSCTLPACNASAP